MKRFIEDPLRVFLSTIATAFVFFILFLFTSCESRSERAFNKAQETKQATQVVEHNADAIIIETLHKGALSGGVSQSGIYKITVDSSEFLIVRTYDGVAIERLK